MSDPSDRLAPARALLTAYDPVEPDRRAQRAEVLAFLDGHADALERSCADGHLTGSAAVVDPSGERVLLVHHKRFRRWFQPGGHADGEADLRAVALKEAVEETGIPDLTVSDAPVDVDVHFGDPDHTHLHLDVRFLVRAPAGHVEPRGEEGAPVRWFSAEELGDIGVDERTARFLRLALAAAREWEEPSGPR